MKELPNNIVEMAQGCTNSLSWSFIMINPVSWAARNDRAQHEPVDTYDMNHGYDLASATHVAVKDESRGACPLRVYCSKDDSSSVGKVEQIIKRTHCKVWLSSRRKNFRLPNACHIASWTFSTAFRSLCIR